MIYDDYIEYTEQYQKRYGEKTVVFMQVGDFFELYAVDNDNEKVGADIYMVCDLCNIQVSRKNKGILENHRQNPLMAGFPIAIVSKHIQTLVQHQYTVVVIRQVTPPPNPKREVTEVISPSTNTHTQGPDNTFLMALYWESHPSQYNTHQFQWSVGMSCVDVTTGDVLVAEAFPKVSDRHYAKDEAYRWIQAIQPREILFIGRRHGEEGENDVETNLMEELYQDLQISHLKLFRTVHEKWGDKDLDIYQKVSYQEQALQKIYGAMCGITRPIEAFDLERSELIRTAMMYAMQFVFEHNEKMMQCLKPPVFYQTAKHLNVHYNGLLQLNVISHVSGEKPLLTILNRCSTAFGSRLFKEHLLNPLLDVKELEHRYDQVDWFRYLDIQDLIHLRKTMGNILDLERYSRKIILEQLAPCEWISLDNSMKASKHLMEWIRNQLHKSDSPYAYLLATCDKLEAYVCTIQEIIDTHLVLEEAGKYWLNDIRGNIFQPGKFETLDLIQAHIQKNMNLLYAIAEALSAIGTSGSASEQTLCKVESNERDGYYLSITKKRWDNLLSKSKVSSQHELVVQDQTISLNSFKTKPVSSTSSILKVSHSIIDKLSHEIQFEQNRLGQLANNAYIEFLRTNGDILAKTLSNMVSLLSEMDVSMTHAKNALDYGYCRPTLQSHHNTEMSASFIRAKNMRHPIIERIQNQLAYVPNDVSMGGDESGVADGWLLYGINAAGKSSLMKAIGLNVIMAQAGSFVPCESMNLAPYEYVFTRISGADNIYRGMSSFTVEMTELRNILMRCNQRSLVLGDELCAGTEALSALSIVAAGIETLAEKKASFVFATHLHELLDMGCIPKNVEVFHIHIDIDEQTGKIIYQRNLSKGPGHSYYGLEVCKALQLPQEFLAKANLYRRKIKDESVTFLNKKTSNYNQHLFMDVCAVCGNPSTETHHIQYQQFANTIPTTPRRGRPPKTAIASTGRAHIGHIPVHAKSNLVPLCDSCHLKEHHGEISIKGYIQTSQGIQLVVEKKE